MFEHLGQEFAITEEEYQVLLDWIRANFIPRETFNDKKNTYGIKYLFEVAENGFYVHDDIINAAMLECGFRPRTTKTQHWVFNISNQSPAFKGLL